MLVSGSYPPRTRASEFTQTFMHIGYIAISVPVVMRGGQIIIK